MDEPKPSMAALTQETSTASILLIEAFYGGSHKQLMDTIQQLLSQAGEYKQSTDFTVFSLILTTNYFIKLTAEPPSSVFSLPELLALRPDLQTAQKLLYFHENQIFYPLRRARTEKDYQYGYNQILSCLVADRIFFNSAHNMRSFLDGVPAFLTAGLPTPPSPRVPDGHRLVREVLSPKSSVLYYLVDVPPLVELSNSERADFSFREAVVWQVERIRARGDRKLKILWNHRWDYDKNPTDFFKAIFALADLPTESKLFEDGDQVLRPSAKRDAPSSATYEVPSGSPVEPPNFLVSVLGGRTQDTPVIFSNVEAILRSRGCVAAWGFVPSQLDYWRELADCDVVVSTANHEFFGVSVVEAVSVGCVPLCPNRLSYPELLVSQHKAQLEDGCLYATLAQLQKRLRRWAARPTKLREVAANALMQLFSSSSSSTEHPWLRPEVLPGLSEELRQCYLRIFGLNKE
ncbi:unnamed protein product [Schistocephalus solidus]|uniref:tRNA-queuosine alpha-mannosyltransferase n=1 Tax=Schistocephalus solidus TaxID=70667 RepID=A0A183SIQ5_SCHSO|nr:unnamed protein product [Schistocephalus solidus]